MKFPIDEIKPAILSSLRYGERNFVVSAPTGSGKSTGLPPMFAEFLKGAENFRVLVLQPRRVAARMLAKSVSKLFGMKEREEVGWHVRFDKCYGKSASVVFLTEGILARMLLANPSLEGVGAVVFDEFHERGIYADISLALTLKSKRELRPDLIVAACSASMDGSALAEYIRRVAGTCSEFECSGRTFPVEIEYSLPAKGEIWDCAALEFSRLASSPTESGNILIFMPGAYEIGRTISSILKRPESGKFEVCALHGDLSPAAQDKILAPSANGRRKVIVSTNVAETSLTIEGVDAVIDGGYARVARYDGVRGVNTLLTERVSLASAIQRAGRAGRLKNGRVVRLWKKSDEERFPRFNDSEIARIDLSQILLWLKCSGMDFNSLSLFEDPPELSEMRALSTLESLEAIDPKSGQVTRLGREMAKFPTEPRYARLLIEGKKRNCSKEAALLVAGAETGRVESDFEGERENLVGDAKSEPERFVRLCEIARESNFSNERCRRAGIIASSARRASFLAEEYERLMGVVARGKGDFGELSKCVLAAFSDRVGVRLNLGTLACRFAGGIRGELRKESGKFAKGLFVALEMREQKNSKDSVRVLASGVCPIEEEYLRELFPSDFSKETSTVFDPSVKAVVSRESTKFRDLTISEKTSNKIDESAAAEILRGKIVSGELKLKNFGDAEKNFISRVNFVAAVCPETGISPVDESALSDIFAQMCMGKTSFSEVKNMDIMPHLLDWLSAEQREVLKAYAPKEVVVNPARRPVKISYDIRLLRASVSALFKDLFSFKGSSLRICGGKIKPTYEILSPGGRVVQTTQNLEEFWKTSWIEVRRELKSRYPKHFKPGDPW